MRKCVDRLFRSRPRPLPESAPWPFSCGAVCASITHAPGVVLPHMIPLQCYWVRGVCLPVVSMDDLGVKPSQAGNLGRTAPFLIKKCSLTMASLTTKASPVLSSNTFKTPRPPKRTVFVPQSSSWNVGFWLWWFHWGVLMLWADMLTCREFMCMDCTAICFFPFFYAFQLSEH